MEVVAISRGLTVAENWRARAGIAPLMSSGTWSSANLAVYAPIILPIPTRIGWLFGLNGATVSGNRDMGIYLPDAEGKPGSALFRFGSVAQAFASQAQIHQIPSPFVWAEGLIYVAMAMDNTTGTVIRLAALTTAGSGAALGGIFTQAAAFPLPATATPSAAGVAVNVPVMGVMPT
jgi:hypothetical protein